MTDQMTTVPVEGSDPHSDAAAALALEAILRSAAAGIITMDSASIIRSANPAAHRLFGYEEGELVGRPVEILMPAPHRGGHHGYVDAYMTTGRSGIIGVGRELPGVRKDGSTFWLHLSIGEFVVAGERMFTGITIDLSAQRAAEDRLRRQEAQFRAIFESQPDAVLITDHEHRVRMANPAFERMFGRLAGDLLDTPPLSIYADPKEWEAHVTAAHDCEDGQSPKAHTHQFARAGGEAFPGVAVHTDIRDALGRNLGCLIAIRDISKDVRREGELMRAQRMEAIGQLTGGIAHDFNNILTVILGNIELLETRLTEGLSETLAREAREAAEMGARLTDRLLTFGRRQHLETARINLNEFILASTEILRRTIGEDIDLSTALAGDLWLTETDPGQIENAVLNLAINARDAMPDGGRIAIETRNETLDADAVALIPELRPGNYVVLSVSDTGHGMSEAVRNRAFEPFFSAKGPGKGSGMGLATIYGFAKQSGGHTTIYSEPGHGTVVNIYLPSSMKADPSATAGSAPATIGTGNGRGETILIVEDDPRVRRLTATRITALGYRVLEAETAPEALRLIEGGATVALVFTDVVMPGGMSGLELVDKLGRSHPGVRTLLTSGYAQEFLGGRAGAVNALLRKPYRQVELAAALETALGGG